MKLIGDESKSIINNLENVYKIVRQVFGLDDKKATRGKAIVSAVDIKPEGVQIKTNTFTKIGSDSNILITLNQNQLENKPYSADDVVAYIMAEVLKIHFTSNLTYTPTSSKRRPLRSISERELEVKNCVSSQSANDIFQYVKSGHDVLMFGKSASGKTVSAIQAALALNKHGIDIKWIDLSEPDRDMWDILIAIIQTYAENKLCIFIDDAQSNPVELSNIALLHTLFLPFSDLKFQIVALGWTSYQKNIIDLWPSAVSISAQPERVLNEMTNASLGLKYSHLNQQQVTYIVSGDLVVATLVLSFIERTNRFPTSEELAKEALLKLIGDYSLDLVEATILYKTAALSQFEIDISHCYLSEISKEHVSNLISYRILRRIGIYLSIGHRSTSRLILRGLTLQFPELEEKLSNPSKLAVDYLRTADNKQLVATLERLDLARLQYSQQDQHGTKYLVNLWKTLQLLLHSLSKAGTQDPSWYDDTGSAALAYRVLNEFNYEIADFILMHLRERWKIDQENYKVTHKPPPPNERKDFDEICKCMKEEESNELIPNYAEVSDSIDFNRMHQTWVLGLLLGVEARAKNNLNRVLALKQIVAREQQPIGNFYPARVPWVTARILIGLSQTGETVDTSDTVRKGCEWLLTQSPSGPYDFGAWNPHTGSWNTITGTTAMCLNALIRCGIQANNESVDLSINYLLDARNEWTQHGKEIDCAFALETFLITGSHWRDFTKELTALIDWVHNPNIWQEVVIDASKEKDESLKIPLIASALVGIIWSIVRSELPLLLEDLATGLFIPESMSHKEYKREIQYIVQRLDEIKLHIRANIEKRLQLLSREDTFAQKTLQYKLNEFREYAICCENTLEVARRLSAESTTTSYSQSFEALLSTVNQLGYNVFHEKWDAII